MLWDLLVKGGRVLDPGQDLDGILDIAISGGKIAAIDADLDQGQAKQVHDANGELVTPGLVDLHTHIYYGAVDLSLEPDHIAARSGTTTMADAGSANVQSFMGFRRFIVEQSQSRVFSFLNISPNFRLHRHPLVTIPESFAALRELFAAHRDVICGLKVFATWQYSREFGLDFLELAREVADREETPIMVHISSTPPPVSQVVDLLHEGDVLTHAFTSHRQRIIDHHGRLLPAVAAARDRGVLLDIGHGAGSFSFKVARQLLDQGVLPDIISTDLYRLSVRGPVYDLPTTLNKFLSLGLSLEEVLYRSTTAPAQVLGGPHGLGALAVGGVADVAVSRLEQGEFDFHDVHGEELVGNQRLKPLLTVCRGKIMRPEDYPEPPMGPMLSI